MVRHSRRRVLNDEYPFVGSLCSVDVNRDLAPLGIHKYLTVSCRESEPGGAAGYRNALQDIHQLIERSIFGTSIGTCEEKSFHFLTSVSHFNLTMENS